MWEGISECWDQHVFNSKGGMIGELFIICPGSEGVCKEKMDMEELVDQANLRSPLGEVCRGQGI